MKSELLYAEKFESPEDFTKALEGYIDYYNNKRIQSKKDAPCKIQGASMCLSQVKAIIMLSP